MTTEWIDQGEVAAESQADPAMAVGEPRNPFLVALGERVRTLRSRQGMTRKAVARAADVSERHLANLEYGTGNASILVLLQVAQALHCTLAELLGDITTSSPEWLLIRELLEHRSEADLRRARQAWPNCWVRAATRPRPPCPHRADRFARRRQEHAGQAPGR
jgi:XRE family aerobic/anaerobic benzoate catabolism transcriptional regulator